MRKLSFGVGSECRSARQLFELSERGGVKLKSRFTAESRSSGCEGVSPRPLPSLRCLCLPIRPNGRPAGYRALAQQVDDLALAVVKGMIAFAARSSIASTT
jgi:hypothetical protein